MGVVVTTGELAASAGDAYGAYQGGMGNPTSQAALGAAVAAGAATIASGGVLGPFAQGVGIGLAPAASATQLAMNIASLQNPNATPAERLAASIGIVGGAAGTLANLIPPAALLTPQGAAAKGALTAAAITATAVQLGIQQNLSTVNELIDEFIREWDQANNLLNESIGSITSAINELYSNARNFIPRSDPLTLDLDNDGLETIGINTANPILFDHDGDGIKAATGWVKSDDAFLVLDRNGNGVIDSGRELFGDSTPLSSGGNAADGFAALAQEDTNNDGVVNSLDARWASLRLWRDMNQDGISQSSELFSLQSQGVAGLVVAKTANSQLLANGNQIADLGHYLRTDGTEGTIGNVAGMADINLASNPSSPMRYR